ncbi:MAG: DUF2225 domain-containing protein [Lachnospiraceae bacterium]|nr:DUF2225 domain-containing protein [Lachnospiraceae bacterium]MEE3461301.1 DUF2225 domain-containing protein [Lachnospiraceae bacterium]
MNLFSGLEKLGFGKLDKVELFEEKKKDDKDKGHEQHEVHVATEEELLFDKKYHCPCCDEEFTSKAVRTGKTKLLGTDTDLRPKYQTVDVLKYDAIVCPKCGYAALNRFFDKALSIQQKLVKENITPDFKGIPDGGDKYSYEYAIMRHKLALMNAAVKKAKSSEKAYICLKTAWILRGAAENVPKEDPERAKKVKAYNIEQLEFLNNAFKGFNDAYMSEEFPLCGMDEMTVTYLLGELARRTGHYEEAQKWVGRVISSHDANERIKNKARDVKELIEKNIKDRDERRAKRAALAAKNAADTAGPLENAEESK